VETLALSAPALIKILVECGLSLTILDEEDRVIAQWPVRPARVAHDGRRIVIFRMNERGEWRGVLLVGSAPNGYDLVAAETRFRDLLHVSLWLGTHAPPQPSPASCQGWPKPPYDERAPR
jgi:hypothetical protein